MSENTSRSTLGNAAIALNALCILKWFAIVALVFAFVHSTTGTVTVVFGAGLIAFYVWIVRGLLRGEESACNRAIRVNAILAGIAVLSALAALSNPISLTVQLGSAAWHGATAFVTYKARGDFRILAGGWKIDN